MSASNLKLFFCLLGMASLAACGGGSNSGSSGGGTSGGGNPTTVTFTFNGSPNSVAPVAVATQIGTGSYTLATLTSGKLTIEIPNGQTNFSVAYLCPSTSGITPPQNLEYIREISTLDGKSYSAHCLQQDTPQSGVATLQVNAAAIPGAAWVNLGSSALPWSGSALDFSAPLAVGTYDIPVSVAKQQISYDNYLAVRILRAQTVPGALNGGATVVFGTGDEVVPQTITYNNVPTGYLLSSPLVIYQTAGGASILLDLNGPPGQYLALPSAAYQSGDSYLFSAEAVSLAGNQSLGGGTSVGVETFSSSGGPQTLTFPAPWSYAGPTPAALPTFNFTYSGFSGPSNVSQAAIITWYQATSSINQISMTATANYQSGSTSMTIPDLSNLTGFLTPQASGTIYWTALLNQGNLVGANPPSGTTQSVSNYGTYALP
jgi:hypothetical protein